MPSPLAIGREAAELERLIELDGYARLKTTDIDWLRKACIDDTYWSLYLLGKVILGFPDLAPDPHLEICEFLSAPDWSHKLLMCPRDSLKTTLLIALEVWEGLRDPQLQCLHAMATEENAEESAQYVDDIFKKNRLVQTLWPDRMPDFAKSSWKKLEKTLPRQHQVRGPTYRWAGSRSKVVGYHYSLIICDDLMEEGTSNSEAEMRRTVSWISNLEPLLINTPRKKGKIIFCGTRWSLADHYATIMGHQKQHTDEKLFRAHGDPRYMVMKRAAVEDGKLFWKQRLDHDALAAKQRALESQGEGHKFYLWYMNDPVDPNLQEFPKPNTWRYNEDKTLIYFMNSNGTHALDPRQLYRTMTIDPASSEGTKRRDSSAITVIGSHPKGQRICLYAWTGQVSTHELSHRVVAICKKFAEEGRPIAKVGLEAAQTQFGLAKFIEEFADEKKVYIGGKIKPLKHGNVGKNDRIRTSILPIVHEGYYYTHARWVELNQQMAQFPYGRKIDLLDALAYQPQIWGTSTFEEVDEIPTEEELSMWDDLGDDSREGYGG